MTVNEINTALPVNARRRNSATLSNNLNSLVNEGLAQRDASVRPQKFWKTL